MASCAIMVRLGNKSASLFSINVTTRQFCAASRSNQGDQKKMIFLPSTPEGREAKLAWVESRLEEAEQQKYGKRRGEEQIRKIMKEERPKNRRINRQMILQELRSLLYSRHALQHGAMRLKDMTKGNQIGKSFLGEDTKVNISLEQARLILFELFRYGKSSRLESLKKKHEKRQKQKRITQEGQARANAKRKEGKS